MPFDAHGVRQRRQHRRDAREHRLGLGGEVRLADVEGAGFRHFDDEPARVLDELQIAGRQFRRERALDLLAQRHSRIDRGRLGSRLDDGRRDVDRGRRRRRGRLGERGGVDGHEERAEQRHEVRVRDEPAIARDLGGREPDVHDFTRRARAVPSVGTA